MIILLLMKLDTIKWTKERGGVTKSINLESKTF